MMRQPSTHFGQLQPTTLRNESCTYSTKDISAAPTPCATSRPIRAGSRPPLTHDVATMKKSLAHYKFSRREIARHRCLDCGVNAIALTQSTALWPIPCTQATGVD